MEFNFFRNLIGLKQPLNLVHCSSFVSFLFRFQYSFVAATPGTNFWHSHTMFQRGDGHFGAYVVRQTLQDDPQSKLYDYDLTEHIIIAQEWFHAVKIVSILVSIQKDMLLMKLKRRQLWSF